MRSARPFLFFAGLSTAAVALSTIFVACSSSSDDPGTTPTDDAGADLGVDSKVTPRDSAKPDTFVVDTGPIDPFAGCTKDPGVPSPDAGTDSGSDTTTSDAPTADASADATSDAADSAVEASVDATPDTRPGGDPIGGADKFTLAMALAGFPAGSGVLTAVITTERGQIVCKLDDAHAPISVANFVGLARGTRPAQRASSDWTYTKFYDGLLWHRVVADFVIQGGDPEGTGGGGPGYDLPVENQVVEPEGTLAMAAAATPSGSQFYIVTESGPAAKYNVFGTCVTDVAKLVKQRDHMQTIEIARCPK